MKSDDGKSRSADGYASWRKVKASSSGVQLCSQADILVQITRLAWAVILVYVTTVVVMLGQLGCYTH